MTLLSLGLVVILAAVVFTLGRQGLHSSAPPALLAVVYLAPAVFLLVTFLSVQDDVRLRFSLLGLGFTATSDNPFDVEVGGDRKEHDLWISAYDDGREEIESGRQAREAREARLYQGEFEVQPASGDDESATVALSMAGSGLPGFFGHRDDKFLQPLRSIELLADDVLSFRGQDWTVELGSAWGSPASFLAEDGRRVEIPARKNALPILGFELPVLRAAPPGLVTYPLSYLVPEPGATPSSEAGFFYLVPQSPVGHSLRLAAFDSSIAIRRGSGPVELEESWTVADGERLHAMGFPRWDGTEFQAGGIRDLRSFRIRAARNGIAAIYDTPEIFALTWEDLRELSEPVEREIETLASSSGTSGEAAAETKLRVHLSMGGWQLTDRSLYFRHASLPVALESLAILEFPVTADQQRLVQGVETFTAATPRGQFQGKFGRPTWLGESHRAAIQIDRIQPPVALGIVALLLALAKIVSARAMSLTRLQALAAATLEGLLALRLLLGFQSWALPPFEEEPYALALAAWLALPFLFLAAAFPVRGGLQRSDLGRISVAAGGLALSLAVCLRFAGGGFANVLWIVLHLGAALIPVARHLGFGQRLADWVQRLTEPSWTERRVLVMWSLVAFVPSVVRSGLFFLGFRESIQLGHRVALSLVHVPLAVVIEALFLLWLWRKIDSEQRFDARVLWPAASFVVGTWLLPAMVVSDLGLALLNLPVFLVALTFVLLAAHGRLAYSARNRLKFVAASLAVLLLLLLAPVGARLMIAVIPDTLAQSLYSERNFLRLLDFADPDRLEGVARKTSEELAVMAAVLRTYTTLGLEGRGYLETEVSPHLRSTALREHVPAVFVAAQWGWAGSTGLVLLFLAIALAGWGLSPSKLRDEQVVLSYTEAGLLGAVGGVAALTVALPSLYMILANYRLALFTGKNAYLLGLDSTADILECCVLLVMVSLGAAAVRDGP